MFNKSTLFNRNDAVPRRETGASPSTTSRPGGSASDATTGRQGTPAKEGSAPAPTESSRSTAAPVPVPSPAASPEARERTVSEAATETGMGARLIVGPDVKLKGAEILDCDTLVVEGRVEATMDSRVIRIAEHGSFIGKVSIDIAEIHGMFEGELTARSQLIIHSTGRVKGAIRYGKLVADEGCELCGDINVLAAGTAAKSISPVEPVPMVNAAAG